MLVILRDGAKKVIAVSDHDDTFSKTVNRLIYGSLAIGIVTWLYEIYRNGLPSLPSIPWEQIQVIAFIFGGPLLFIGLIYLVGVLVEKIGSRVFSNRSEGDTE